MNKCGITTNQATRLRDDFKRAAHIHTIIKKRMEELGVKDELLKMSLLLAKEEYDAIFNDFEGMLNGNAGD